MDARSIRTFVSVTGALSGICGLAVLFLSQYYVIAFVLIIVGIFISSISYIKRTQSPIEHGNIFIEWDIKDSSGEEAIVTKKKELKVNNDGIMRVTDSDFTASGEIEPIESNIGEISDFVDEGGNKCLYTSFRTPLEKNEKIDHVVKLKYIDSFIKDTESVSHVVNSPQSDLYMEVNFPEERKPIDTRLFKSYQSTKSEISQEVTKNNGQVYFRINNPTLGERYTLEWDW